MNIYIINDTRNIIHAGCYAVMDSIYSLLGDHNIIGSQYCSVDALDDEAFKLCDCVVCNGEGTMHHDCYHGGRLLKLLGVAKELGKKVLLINAVFQNSPNYYSSVLKQLDLFTVREVLSLDNATLSGVKPYVYLDACVCNLNREEVYPHSEENAGRVVVGSAGATAQFAGLFKSIADKYGLCREALSGRYIVDSVRNISGAALYITGQHHGLYTALLARVPFLVVPSNSHKIEGLLSWAESDIPICRSESDILHMMDNYKNYTDSYNRIFDWFVKAPILTKDIINSAIG